MGVGTYITGLVFALVAVAFAIVFGGPLLRDIRARQVLATGVTAPAKVIDLKDTGNRYNYQPEIAIELEVMPPGRPPFRAVVKRVMTVADAAAFAPGTVLTVKYDPAHPSDVALDGSGH